MWNWLNFAWNNWKYHRRIKRLKIQLWEGVKFPSQTYFKYPPEHDFQGRQVLNLGCGLSTYAAPNVVNLDYAPHKGINIVCDLAQGKLPFPDESFDLILANHVLEHIPNWWGCFKELCRVLKPEGKIEVWIPPVSSDTALTYRDHINYLGVESFTGVGVSRRGGTNLMAYHDDHAAPDLFNIDLIWRGYHSIIVWWLLYSPPWFADWAMKHLRNTVSEEGFVFKKRSKDGTC